ncbi:hypothetical protein MMC17_002371 [Xylographa soralifera]|nr:hypothetical protein [Xylographa soralifera]
MSSLEQLRKRIHAQKKEAANETKIGGGGFSTVHDVLEDPAHQDIDPEAKGTGLCLIRTLKRSNMCMQYSYQKIRTTRFEEDRSILKAVQALSSGLRRLHYFERSGVQAIEPSTLLHGTHQDIKPRNVLFRGTGFILTDFRLSRLKPVEEGSQMTWKNATVEYGAPEFHDESTRFQGQIARASDVWSLSCVISS